VSGRDIGASVMQRLLNKSRTQSRTFQELLQYFAMESDSCTLSDRPLLSFCIAAEQTQKAFLLRNPLAPYPRCWCGVCPSCKDNQKWDRIFAKFAVQDYGETKGVFQCALRDI
jgi:hypothetical protein